MRILLARTLLVVVALLAASVAVALAEPPHWDYKSRGGAAGWGSLTEAGSGDLAFPDCNLSQQSPVSIPATAPLESGLSLDYHTTELLVLNNGHAIQVNQAPGSMMSVDGKLFELLQFHFHSPSEHELEGRQTALEAHFVHQASDGEVAVLGVMIVAGGHNPTFQVILHNLPESEGEVAGEGSIDAAGLLPVSLSYYDYDGSFTTPPCTEGVKWYVLSEPVSVSLQQVAAFRALPFLNHEGEFVGNARPVQPLNRRLDTDVSTASPITPPSTGSAGLAGP